MNVGFDPVKNAANKAKHGLGFEQASKLDWKTAVTKKDNRSDYGEDRFITHALMSGRVCVLVWTWRDGRMRPISFRKANAKERKRYEEEKN
jgi:uncharacterized DUF497 family protein